MVFSLSLLILFELFIDLEEGTEAQIVLNNFKSREIFDKLVH